MDTSHAGSMFCVFRRDCRSALHHRAKPATTCRWRCHWLTDTNDNGARLTDMYTLGIVCLVKTKYMYVCSCWNFTDIWVRSGNCGCLVTWFCYRSIAKPGNKTVAVPWPHPYILLSTNDKYAQLAHVGQNKFWNMVRFRRIWIQYNTATHIHKSWLKGSKWRVLFKQTWAS